MPELVQKDDLPAASALNGIEFNFARAVGPALAGVVIAFTGVGAAFLINSISFFGVILVVTRWKRPVHKRTTPPETVTGATVAAIRYVRYSPKVRAVLFRAGAAMFFASGLLALLPSIAHRMNDSPIGYGILLGCFGGGAVLGALAMQRARAWWSADAVVSAGIAAFGLMTTAAGVSRVLPLLSALMLVAGAAWISFISLFNVQILNQTPDWVRARVLSVSMLVFQGAVAAGSANWGAVASRLRTWAKRCCGSASDNARRFWGLFLRLPDASVDLTPWNHWRLPAVDDASMSSDNTGPVLVTVEYHVDPERVPGVY